jgi:hypothetical protein
VAAAADASLRAAEEAIKSAHTKYGASLSSANIVSLETSAAELGTRRRFKYGAHWGALNFNPDALVFENASSTAHISTHAPSDARSCLSFLENILHAEDDDVGAPAQDAHDDVLINSVVAELDTMTQNSAARLVQALTKGHMSSAPTPLPDATTVPAPSSSTASSSVPPTTALGCITTTPAEQASSSSSALVCDTTLDFFPSPPRGKASAAVKQERAVRAASALVINDQKAAIETQTALVADLLNPSLNVQRQGLVVESFEAVDDNVIRAQMSGAPLNRWGKNTRSDTCQAWLCTSAIAALKDKGHNFLNAKAATTLADLYSDGVQQREYRKGRIEDCCAMVQVQKITLRAWQRQVEPKSFPAKAFQRMSPFIDVTRGQIVDTRRCSSCVDDEGDVHVITLVIPHNDACIQQSSTLSARQLSKRPMVDSATLGDPNGSSLDSAALVDPTDFSFLRRKRAKRSATARVMAEKLRMEWEADSRR